MSAEACEGARGARVPTLRACTCSCLLQMSLPIFAQYLLFSYTHKPTTKPTALSLLSHVKSSSSSASSGGGLLTSCQVDGATVVVVHRCCCTGSPISALRASRSSRAVAAASLSFSRAWKSSKHRLTSSVCRPPVLRHSGLDEKRPSTCVDNHTSANQRSTATCLKWCGKRWRQKLSVWHVSPRAQRSVGLEYVARVSSKSAGRETKLTGFSSCVAIASARAFPHGARQSCAEPEGMNHAELRRRDLWL